MLIKTKFFCLKKIFKLCFTTDTSKGITKRVCDQLSVATRILAKESN